MVPPKKTVNGPQQFRTESPEETIELAATLGPLCRPGDVFCLQGTLGAGKTHFVKGLAKGLEAGEETVSSPTYVLLNRYEGRLTLNHFDAYRLEDPEEMQEIGCEEIFDGDGVSVVEWADRVERSLPPQHFLITMRIKGETRRDLLFGAVGEELPERLGEMAEALRQWKICEME